MAARRTLLPPLTAEEVTITPPATAAAASLLLRVDGGELRREAEEVKDGAARVMAAEAGAVVEVKVAEAGVVVESKAAEAEGTEEEEDAIAFPRARRRSSWWRWCVR